MGVSVSMLGKAFARFVKAAERAGFPGTDRYVFQQGGGGTAYRVFQEVERGGLADLPMTHASGYLGATRSEAYEALGHMTRTLDAVNDLHREGEQRALGRCGSTGGTTPRTRSRRWPMRRGTWTLSMTTTHTGP